MAVAPAYWLSNSLLAIETLLANCATYQVLMGVSTVQAARDKTIWQSSRTAAGAAPYAIIQIRSGVEGENEALRVVQHTDAIAVYLRWNTQKQTGDSEKDMATRELNSFGNLLSDIAALVGTGTDKPIRALRTWEAPERISDTDETGTTDAWDATITFTWEI